MVTPANITSYAVTPVSATVNSLTDYKMDFFFLFPHYNGDRIIVTFPDGVLLGAGFQCTAITTGVTINCFQNSQTIL